MRAPLAPPVVLTLALAVAATASSAEAQGSVRASRLADGTLVLTNDPGSTRPVSAPRRHSRREPSPDLAPVIDRYSQARGLDPVLVRAVIQTESAYDARAVSSKGAIGLMQLMPATARELGVDPWSPEQNVDGGTLYLRRLLDAFEGDLHLALAGYNAGPGAVQRYGGIPPYRETTDYVSRVLSLYHGRPVSVSPSARQSTASARSAAPGNGAAPRSSRTVRVHRDAEGRLVFSTPR